MSLETKDFIYILSTEFLNVFFFLKTDYWLIFYRVISRNHPCERKKFPVSCIVIENIVCAINAMFCALSLKVSQSIYAKFFWKKMKRSN